MLRSALPIGLSLLLCSVAAQGQSWVGFGGLRVAVRVSGKPLPGASVTLEFLGAPGVGGPTPSETDQQGQVELGQLADGPWLVSVRHPEAMGYDARVELMAGKKPRETAAALVKVASATARLKVRFSAGPVSKGADTRRASPPAVDPGGLTPPSVPADATPRPTPMSPIGNLPPFLRTSRNGSCPECRAGEWAVSAVGEPRGPGGPGCPPRLGPLVERLADELSAETDPTAPGAEWAGPIDPASVPAFARAIPADLQTGNCQILALKLPAGAKMGGFQLEVEGPAGIAACPPDAGCPGGAGRLEALPATTDRDIGRVVVAAFRHDGARRDVKPKLTVYFVPTGDWRP